MVESIEQDQAPFKHKKPAPSRAEEFTEEDKVAYKSMEMEHGIVAVRETVRVVREEMDLPEDQVQIEVARRLHEHKAAKERQQRLKDEIRAHHAGEPNSEETTREEMRRLKEKGKADPVHMRTVQEKEGEEDL